MTDNYGRDKINKSVTTGQSASYKSTSADSKGTWRIRFVENDHKKWNCWIVMYDYSGYSLAAKEVYTDNSNQSIVTPTFYKANDKTYIIPSKGHKQTVAVLKNKKLTMKDLATQTFDITTKTFVQSFENYNNGDSIIFEDRIKKIKYNKDGNFTEFTFEGQDGEDVNWAFDKDLTQKYKLGQILNLKFKVVTDYTDNNINVETLDYVQDGINAQTNGKYVDINNYQ